MIHFEWLWMFVFLPIPFLVYRMSPPVHATFSALKVPFYDVLGDQTRSVQKGRRIAIGIAALAWLFLLVASARPQWIGEPIVTNLSGRDLMLAVDLSDSMKERDMLIDQHRVNRLQAVQAIAGKFIQQREGDRLGLILFGSEAYLQSPLTLDGRTVQTLLDEAEIGIAGSQTAIGNAIALASKRLQNRETGDKVLILLTDGENTAGSITPEQATQLAQRTQLKVYTIGIGSERLSGLSGFLRGPAVDERALKRISDATQGQFFRARNTDELAQIYAYIDQLETSDEQANRLRPIKELFYWPGAVALLFFVFLFNQRLRAER